MDADEQDARCAMPCAVCEGPQYYRLREVRAGGEASEGAVAAIAVLCDDAARGISRAAFLRMAI